MNRSGSVVQMDPLMRKALLSTVLAIAWAVCLLPTRSLAAPQKHPNIILFFVDNLGHGDLGCTGSQQHRTPHIDRLAEEGLKLNSFYSASGVCTPSRAALLTGCYPRRVNMHESETGSAVLRPVSSKGLHPDERTIAEVLKSVGYTTGIFGKWHLGDQPSFLPTRHGFDEYLGIPYSDDMTPREGTPWPPLPLIKEEDVIEAPVDRNLLASQCTKAAVDFIARHRHQHFFLYVPHPMPGSTKTPFASQAFRGKSANGSYGDSVEELDWCTGEILRALDAYQLTSNSLVIWTSDNGAPRRQPPQGSCAPYKGYGYDTSEGAMRMPCLARWPGHIPAGTSSDALCTTMDLLPTFAAIAHAELPAHKIDGHNILPILTSPQSETSPWDTCGFGYYRLGQLQAIRAGQWRLDLPLSAAFVTLGRKTKPTPLALYNVVTDVSQEHDVASSRPDIVSRLTALAQPIRKEIGDVGQPGLGQRPAGMVPNPRPLKAF